MTENTTTGEGATAELTAEQEDVLEALRDVVDPELGINVVDLGLIYGVDVDAERIARRAKERSQTNVRSLRSDTNGTRQ